MKLTFLRGECGNERTCPNLNLTDRDTLVVQGYIVTDSVVEIPLTLVPEVAGLESPHSHLKMTANNTVLVSGRPVTGPTAISLMARTIASAMCALSTSCERYADPKRPTGGSHSC